MAKAMCNAVGFPDFWAFKFAFEAIKNLYAQIYHPLQHKKVECYQFRLFSLTRFGDLVIISLTFLIFLLFTAS